MKSKITFILALAAMVVLAAGTAWPLTLNIATTGTDPTGCYDPPQQLAGLFCARHTACPR